jgi:hypothetical protein
VVLSVGEGPEKRAQSRLAFVVKDGEGIVVGFRVQLRSLEGGFVASTGSAVCTTTGSTGVALFCSVLVAGESGTMVTGTAILGLKYFRFAEDAGRAICLGWLLLERRPDRSLMLGGDSELL